MRTFIVLAILAFACEAPAAETKDASEARRILSRYLATVHPEGPSRTDPYDPKVDAQVNKARLARLSILAELKAMPTEAVSAAGPVLFEQAGPVQRHEITGFLSDSIHTRECAELLHRVLQDVREPRDEDAALYEELVRCSAVHGLRMMARRTDRSGGKRLQRKPDFEPQVPGLAPYLVSAANDKAERVRVSALYALADSRDPVAAAELRNRLEDRSEKVRLYAACFLTEYQDAAGLPEMRKALSRLKEAEPKNDFTHYTQVEMLLASFERITGKSFGEIPLNPLLSSVTHGAAGGAQRYKELLGVWEAWWNWQPGEKPARNP